MKKFIFSAAFALAPFIANAAPYALELSAPCSMQVADAAGQQQTVTEPQGYVVGVASWDGTTNYTPLDACGQPLVKVVQVNGVPAQGAGGVTLTLSLAEQQQVNAAAAQAHYNALIAGGLTITSTSTPAVDGTYGTAASDQANFNAMQTYVLANGTLEQTPEPWFLENGSPVMLPSAAAFKEIATAIGNFVTNAKVAAAEAGEGMTVTWPSSSVSVP